MTQYPSQRDFCLKCGESLPCQEHPPKYPGYSIEDGSGPYPGNTVYTLVALERIRQTAETHGWGKVSRDDLDELAAQLARVPELEQQVAMHADYPELYKRAEAAEDRVRELVANEADQRALTRQRDELVALTEHQDRQMSRMRDDLTAPCHGLGCKRCSDCVEAAERQRDELAEALREIAEQDPLELVLDPTWSQRIARAALAKVSK